MFLTVLNNYVPAEFFAVDKIVRYYQNKIADLI